MIRTHTHIYGTIGNEINERCPVVSTDTPEWQKNAPEHECVLPGDHQPLHPESGEAGYL